jgi:hypothetical protein
VPAHLLTALVQWPGLPEESRLLPVALRSWVHRPSLSPLYFTSRLPTPLHCAALRCACAPLSGVVTASYPRAPLRATSRRFRSTSTGRRRGPINEALFRLFLVAPFTHLYERHGSFKLSIMLVSQTS